MKKIYSSNRNNINIALNDFKIVNNFENDVDLIIFSEDLDTDVLELAKVKGIKWYGGKRLSKLVEFNEFIEKLPNDAWTVSLFRNSYDCTPVTDTIVE